MENCGQSMGNDDGRPALRSFLDGILYKTSEMGSMLSGCLVGDHNPWVVDDDRPKAKWIAVHPQRDLRLARQSPYRAHRACGP